MSGDGSTHRQPRSDIVGVAQAPWLRVRGGPEPPLVDATCDVIVRPSVSHYRCGVRRPATQPCVRVNAHPITDVAESVCSITHRCGVFWLVLAYSFTFDALDSFSSLATHRNRSASSVFFTSVPNSEIRPPEHAPPLRGKVRVPLGDTLPMPAETMSRRDGQQLSDLA